MFCPEMSLSSPQLTKIITSEPLAVWGVFILPGKVSKLSTTFVLLVFSESAPISVDWDHRNRHQSKTEYVDSTNPNLLFLLGFYWVWWLPLLDGWNTDPFLPCFPHMDYYPYATLRADGWFHCDEMHRLPYLAPGHAALLWPHGDSHVPWLPIPWVQAWMLWGPCGYPDSPLRPEHDGLVHHGWGQSPRWHSREVCPLGHHGVFWVPLARPQRHRRCLVLRPEQGQCSLEWALGCHWWPRAWDFPRELGVHGTQRPARELPTLGGQCDRCLPMPTPRGVRWPSAGTELPYQGHSEGQLRAPLIEPPPWDACQGAEW
jgi:hypothetical protein